MSNKCQSNYKKNDKNTEINIFRNLYENKPIKSKPLDHLLLLISSLFGQFIIKLVKKRFVFQRKINRFPFKQIIKIFEDKIIIKDRIKTYSLKNYLELKDLPNDTSQVLIVPIKRTSQNKFFLFMSKKFPIPRKKLSKSTY